MFCVRAWPTVFTTTIKLAFLVFLRVDEEVDKEVDEKVDKTERSV